MVQETLKRIRRSRIHFQSLRSLHSEQNEERITTYDHIPRVDDLKSSHKDKRVNDNFEQWLQKIYGRHGEVTSHRDKKHDYLGMELDYTEDGKVKFGMKKYVESMLNEFPIKFKKTNKAASPAGDSLFNEGQGKKLETGRAETYHTTVARGLFLCKRARPDIQPTIADEMPERS
jgi:hypothetical protein